MTRTSVLEDQGSSALAGPTEEAIAPARGTSNAGAAARAEAVRADRAALQFKRASGAPPSADDRGVAEAGFQGASSPLPAAARIGAGMGADVSSVQTYRGPEAAAACDALGAEAYTVGNRVAFKDASPSVALQAHETAHVAQQGGLGAAGLQKFSPDRDDAMEVQADAFAEKVAGPGSLPERGPTERPGGVQRFAPNAHRQSTAEGLAGSFGAQEIGEIYAANWERDFSQGAPQLADLVLSWKEAKRALRQGPDSEAFKTTSARFRSAIQKVLDMGIMDSLKESMGGYQACEHMDNPGGTDANERWGIPEEKPGQLPGYILDGKAYIKDHMVKAVESYRERRKLGSAGKFDNWKGGKKPKGYGEANKKATDPELSRKSIVAETAEQAEQALAARDPGAQSQDRALEGTAEDFAVAADSLGRATHGLQDFFAHSNWLELACDLSKRLGANPQAKLEQNLITGTFELYDKAHALGHKLTAIADGFQKDFDLLLKVFGRTEASTALDQAGNEKLKERAMSSLKTESWTVPGDIYDVSAAASDMNKAVARSEGKLDLGDIVTNKEWLEAVRQKGIRLIERGDANAPATGHGKIAKDQPEPGHEGHNHAPGHHGHAHAEKNFELALELSTHCDRLVIAPLAQAMKAPEAEAARAGLEEQLRVVDQIIAPPDPSHPLFGVVKGR